MHEQLSNYFLIKYEDFVSRPETHARRLCEFLNVQYKDEMLRLPVIGSSYDEFKGTMGFNKDNIVKWKNIISPVTAKLLAILTRKAMRRFGYW